MGNVTRQGQPLDALRGIFGDRLKPGPLPEDGRALAAVSPRDADEVQELSATAARFSLRLVPLGAGTSAAEGDHENAVLVHFDLMGAARLPEGDEPWVEAQPGATLLSLENNLGARDLGLTVYPTSAPRATVGGWLAGEGIGVGSFEYGSLPANVLSADVVLAGGGRKTVPGEGLPDLLRREPGTLVVNARLRTRPARDIPFAAGFARTDDLAGAVVGLVEGGVPLWHLAFLNAAMSRARDLGEHALLFGAYPQERRSSAVEEVLVQEFEANGGRTLPPADVHRAWGQRFSPVAPSHPTPEVVRRTVPLPDVPAALLSEKGALQGNVSRSGEVLLLRLVG